VGFAAARGGVGAKWRGVLVGSKHPRPEVLGVDRSSIAETDASNEVTVAPVPMDPLEPVARVYFKIVRVLDTLDADHDRIISAWEMATASKALLRLDSDHDGRLSAEECGFSLGDAFHRLPAEERNRAALAFMRANPVLAALDLDGDGTISAEEIAGSSTALRRLDRNGDGALSPVEVLPEVVDVQAATVLVRLDANRDGRISPAERASYEGQEYRKLLDRSDKNGDGYVTADELSRELRVRLESARQLNAVVLANRPR
jgi:Ca2+-binding EF-hand superfamily protein